MKYDEILNRLAEIRKELDVFENNLKGQIFMQNKLLHDILSKINDIFWNNYMVKGKK